MAWLIQGWLFGIAYVAPIGMQNMYVINTAVQKSKVRALQVALITIFFDITLAMACFFGIGLILEKFDMLKMIVLGAGSIAVIIIGVMLIKSKPSESKELDMNKSIMQVIATCFVVTWMNPQAIIDGTLLLGGFKATLSGPSSALFISGVCLSSTMWFLGIVTIVSKFKDVFNNKVMQTINIVCGGIIVLFGVKLMINFVSLIL